jgi:hypothetical protein
MKYNLSVISQDKSCNLKITVARDGFLGAVDIGMVPCLDVDDNEEV